MADPARRAYASTWVRWALTETFRTAGGTSLLVSIAGGVAGGFYQWLFGGSVSIAPALVGAGTALFIVFLIHLVAAPFRMAHEAQVRHATQLQNAASAHATTTRLLHAEREEHDELKRQVSQRKVEPDHFADLKAIAQKFKTLVEGNTWAKTNSSDVDAFLGHFPEVIGEIVGWNDALDKRRDVAPPLEARMIEESKSHGVVRPHFASEYIVTELLSYVQVLAADDRLGEPFRIEWLPLPFPEVPGVPPVALYWAMYPDSMVRLDLEDGSPVLERDGAIAMVEGLFRDAQTWPETLAYAERDKTPGGWQDLKAPLLVSLDWLVMRTFYWHGDGVRDATRRSISRR